MFKEIKVGDTTVPMLANGATALRYKHIFGKDLITEFQGAEQDNAKVIDCIPEIAFIMAMAAEAKEGKVDMNLLSNDMFMTWLEQFDPMDLPNAAEDIVNLYIANSLTSSTPKKKEKKVRT